ncbi:diguanylate cyclase domain-containing protein [Rahnella victoriana]|uniref:Diguanylate cyclase n=1 Tax=Rahnella victoriana TaxID=1510570 RepID=A0ABS0DMZ3_9GAMM|nr:diguanylate cyclase [Rahnella victoriana]MBF7955236.1 diguanylate cyclase [Rahnella victoriana]
MLVPQPAVDEQARLAILASLGILDSPRIEEIDRITRMAARQFQVRAVVVSLIDTDRQWFLSHTGVDINQSPRDTSFCGHTILESGPLIVRDARLDLRFHDNPLVTGAPHIVFYAGCALHSKEGIALGAMCLIDDRVREWSDEDQQTLTDMTALVQSYIFHLENRQYTARVEDNLAKSEALFEQTFAHAAVGFSLVGLDWRWLRINPQVCNMLGYAEYQLRACLLHDVTHPEDIYAENILVPRLLSGEINSFSVEKLLQRADGSTLWVTLTASLVRNPAGEAHHYIVVINDITERKHIEQALYTLQEDLERRVAARTNELQVAMDQLHQEIAQRLTRERELTESKNRLRAITDNIPALICHVDASEQYTFVNHFHANWYGVEETQVSGKTVREVVGDDSYQKIQPYILQALQGIAVSYEIELPHHSRHGKGGVLHTTLIPCDDIRQGYYGLSTDISEIKELQAQLEFEANHDPLTGLPNRRAFQQSLMYAARQQEKADKDIALLFLDIDNFKAYNDTYGHEFGDLILKFFGHTLRSHLRSQDVVARLAGDEFTVLLGHLVNTESDVSRICISLMSALHAIERVAGVPVALSASIGVAVGRARQPLLPDTLMARADAAMYRAKQSGKGRYYLG